MYDLIIKNGTIIDGTGSPRKISDIAIKDGKISEIGKVSEQSRRVINAENKFVTPGWVDIHTHYDGQATWDPYLTPSSWHGVTTCVFGNCGVGFAPVQKGKEKYLIKKLSTENKELYGSVKPTEISKIINEKDGLVIEPSMIQLMDDIKSLGEFKVNINLHSEVQAQIKIKVIPAEVIQ